MRSHVKLFLALLSVLFLFTITAPTMGGQGDGITISKKNATISEVLNAIEEQKGLIFVTNEDVDLTRKVDVNARNADVDAVLRQVFAGTPVSWTRSGVNVYLGAKSAANAPPQTEPTLMSRGIVIDQDGDPLPGASLIVPGTKIGFITDAAGRFSITGIRFPARLVVSYLGFSDTEIYVTGRENNLVVTLYNDMNRLSDVVVVGYGTQKRVNVTGAVSVVDGKDLERRPVTNTVGALQGADPGLLLTTNSGTIQGDKYKISIRGNVSLNSGSPLVLIDGVEGSLVTVNPNDVESVSILKDASTCAIYGAKASAGVVLVTTKGGASGKSKVTYGGRYGIQKNTTSTDFMTCGYDYTMLTNEFYQPVQGMNAWTFSDEQMEMMKKRRDDKTEHPDRPWIIPDETGAYTWVYLANYDWWGYLFKRARPEQEHNVSISGGNDKVNYYLSGRYLDRDGIFNHSAADNYKSYNFKAKIDAKVTGWLNSSTIVSFERSIFKYGALSDQDGTDAVLSSNNSVFYNVDQNISPCYMPYNPDGSINVQPSYMARNVSQLGNGRIPIWMDGRNKNQKTANYLTLTERFTVDIFEGLKGIGDFSYRRQDNLGEYRCLPVTNAYDNVHKKWAIGHLG